MSIEKLWMHFFQACTFKHSIMCSVVSQFGLNKVHLSIYLSFYLSSTFLQNISHPTDRWLWAEMLKILKATHLSPRFCFKWLTGLNCRKTDTKKREKSFLKTRQNVNIWRDTGMWQTFGGLTAAAGGVPGGVCVPTSGLKVWFAICMHSSRVLRKVVHVDFTMFPVSIPA